MLDLGIYHVFPPRIVRQDYIVVPGGDRTRHYHVVIDILFRDGEVMEVLVP